MFLCLKQFLKYLDKICFILSVYSIAKTSYIVNSFLVVFAKIAKCCITGTVEKAFKKLEPDKTLCGIYCNILALSSIT